MANTPDPRLPASNLRSLGIAFSATEKDLRMVRRTRETPTEIRLAAQPLSEQRMTFTHCQTCLGLIQPKLVKNTAENTGMYIPGIIYTYNMYRYIIEAHKVQRSIGWPPKYSHQSGLYTRSVSYGKLVLGIILVSGTRHDIGCTWTHSKKLALRVCQQLRGAEGI